MLLVCVDTNDAGEKKPGTKGVMLNVAQWQAINNSISKVNKAVEKG
jgi:hypothetical protein